MTIFRQSEIDAFKERVSDNKVHCFIRNRKVHLKPEERIRQLWLVHLERTYHYPFERMRVEYPVTLGTTTKYADIAIIDEDDPERPLAIVEVKKERRRDGKEQLRSYCNATGAPIAIWSNGQTVDVWRRQDPNHFLQIPRIPNASQTIDEIIDEPWYISTLIDKEKKREDESRSLRDLIVDMENEVLANSGVDVFEEVFKLIFVKLYDEIYAYEHNSELRFRNANTTSQVMKAISGLFEDAKKRWPGVFPSDSRVALESEHLQICVGTLESWKLFNSNLDIIDDAFEYLVSKSAKGEKGQFFTPRWVTEMCVRMLDPKENEAVIDPACGSAGFLIHTTFHVWRSIIDDLGLEESNLFTAEEKPKRCRSFVNGKVFGIDFDEKVVRVSRCINLIAGDGESNILHLNSLDWKGWKDKSRDVQWSDLYGTGWTGLQRLRASKHEEDYRYFRFDVCMANPPFAGEITQARILAKYDIAHKANRRIQSKMFRDILFVERNIDLLRPGGRIAIVLPEGRFNNSSDAYVRDYIMQRCRVLAVVSLHQNTFKPHTGIKTCVLFAQKWNDDPKAGELCQKVQNYNIFFAIQEVESVDNRGAKIYVEENGSLNRDAHGHLMVRHDLYNHDGLTEDGIAESFRVWAAKEGLSFARQSLTVHGGEMWENTWVSTYHEATRNTRLDPLFFSPEFTEAEKRFRRYAARIRSIKDFAVVNNRGVQPAWDDSGEVLVVVSANILEGHIDYENLKRTTLEEWKS